MDFDSYYFISANFEAIKTKEVFEAKFEKNDRFYNYLLPFLQKGKAEGMTPLTIDYLCIPTFAYSNIENKTFQMTAKVIFQKKYKDRENICRHGFVTIDRLCIDNIDPRNIEKNGDEMVIKMCNLVLQYQTKIKYVEIE
ncbi:hypothetical protein [Anaerotignum sp. MSJ-24]|uniref:hypothetical protein n=1 Tax=Anaerotignum sp. MSJ-24 TaxID=2841521 RepID=UPI001C10D31A|nr:hypothetical protein [Anaerotignum sp. MSJ-24]MBU5463986.1 hypothetical protein [Anaerotignum sp. MSJ-24]